MLYMRILQIIIKEYVGGRFMKIAPLLSIVQGFNIAFDFPVFFNWAIVSVDLVHEYLTFKLSYSKFQVYLSIYEYTPHNNEQFGSCLIKIKQILSILQGF